MADCTIRRRTDEWIEVVLGTPTYAGELGKAHMIMLGQLGIPNNVSTNDDVYEVVVGDDEVILRAKAPATSQRSFGGVVQDSGGGMVAVLVDRDTESYPTPGDRVRIEVTPRARA